MTDSDSKASVLVVGSGGREHALAWKLGQSSRVADVFVAPGNAGTRVDAVNVDIKPDDVAGLVNFAGKNGVGTVVIGPEAPLAAGLSDKLAAAGLRVFGPSAGAAELEGSKVFCKNLLRSADVPTAEYQAFRSRDDALRFLYDRFDDPHAPVSVVVKADGLAAGKGVVVCNDRGSAIEAVQELTQADKFGGAGRKLIIEEKLTGPEVSVLAITDGETIITLPPAQDHKPAGDGDRGPNTGGMGAYCPAPVLDDQTLRWVQSDILVPVVHAMKRSRRPFKGVLYAGLMLTPGGPKVLEFNVRFGDPECQPLLMRLQTDLMDIVDATIDGRLGELESMAFDRRPAICVVMASEGYPGDYSQGHAITGIAEADAIDDVKVFHAGTALEGNRTVTAGGRVLGVTAIGETIPAAKLKAYTAVQKIRWRGAWCRKDISDKAFEGLLGEAAAVG